MPTGTGQAKLGGKFEANLTVTPVDIAGTGQARLGGDGNALADSTVEGTGQADLQGTFTVDPTAEVEGVAESDLGGTNSAVAAVDVTGIGTVDLGGTFDAEVLSTWLIIVENPVTPTVGTFPTLTFQISQTPPMSVPDWIDASPYLVAFTSYRGRGGELDDFAAGTGTITLANREGVFDRDNNTSPYASLLTTNRRVRVTASYDADETDATDPTTATVLDQYVDVWPMDDDPTFDSRQITITTTDALGLLANRDIQPARPFTLDDPDFGVLDAANKLGGQPHFDPSLTGVRIAEILDLIGWPLEFTDIDSGVTPVTEDFPTDKVLPVLQQLARTEMGSLFVSGGGVATFRQRRAWTHLDVQNTSQITFTDDPTSLTADTGEPYEDITIDPGSKALIKNRITRTAVSGETFTTIDVDSQNTYGVLEDSKTDLLTARFADIVAQCQWVLARYKDGVPRVTSLTVSGIPDPADLFPFMLTSEIGTRVTAGRTPKIGGALVERVCNIESVAHTATAPSAWRTTWSLTEADTNVYFTLDDDIRGVLNAGNLLAA